MSEAQAVFTEVLSELQTVLHIYNLIIIADIRCYKSKVERGFDYVLFYIAGA
jgi:hypothetical protein